MFRSSLGWSRLPQSGQPHAAKGADRPAFAAFPAMEGVPDVAEKPESDQEELTLSDERMAILEPKLRALLTGIKGLERLESFELEPMTNARRWWRDDDQS
jgi:hypothetical protein